MAEPPSSTISASTGSVVPAGGRSLSILHLEDDLHDRELVRRLLVKNGFLAEFTYASSRGEFQQALEQAQSDLILADFTLPGYDGMAALRTALAKCPAVPFLFLSGTIGEEQAIFSLKSGATDYVLKNRLELLIPAVHRALREADERARRQRAEEALKLAEERFRSIFENAVEGIFQSAPEGRYLIANPSLALIFGYASPEALLAGPHNLGHRHLVASALCAEFEHLLLTQGHVRGFEAPANRQDGTAIWISVNARAVRGAGAKILYYEGSVEDITARKQAEDALKKSEERFREMAENIQDVFWVTSPDGQEVLYVSPAYQAVWGRSVDSLLAQPKSWLESVLDEDRPQLLAMLQQLADGHPYRLEYRIQRPDGSERWIEDRGYPVRNPDGKVERTVGCATDITERKRLEGDLRQVQKMESIGQLAGGIAHDFNNALTVINGHVYLLLDREGLGPEATQSLREVFAAGEHAARLTRQLLLFSRKQAIQTQVVDLNEVVQDIAPLLRRLVGNQIDVELNLLSPAALVQADVGMLEQILVNLAVNARDAMPKGGTLLIKSQIATEVMTVDDSGPDTRSTKFACLSVKDQGCGIAPEILPRIFEPFFTTKDVGQGTGLGLATVYAVVKQHQGRVEVTSQVGVGSEFKVFLPLTSAEVIPVKPKPDESKTAGGKETVLLVEDETPVRELAAAVLRRLGYRVLQAASGKEALEVWQWHAPKISLLLTDIVMPDDLTGVELAKILCAQNPQLKVIFASGYSDASEWQHLPVSVKSLHLQKPYHPKTLAKALRELLDD